jgi:hypothetical protein
MHKSRLPDKVATPAQPANNLSPEMSAFAGGAQLPHLLCPSHLCLFLSCLLLQGGECCTKPCRVLIPLPPTTRPCPPDLLKLHGFAMPDA